MASYVPVIKNGANGAIFYIGLIDQSNTKLLKSSPTLAAGDFKVSIDGAALANLGTLPTVTPAAGRQVKVTLSQDEVNGDNITVQCVDAAGAEWCDLLINIQTVARQIDDLAYPATSGRSMVVDAAGLVDANMVKAGASGAGNTITTSGGVTLPAATIASTTNITGGTITTTTNLTNLPAITANWLTAAGTAADFGTEIAAAIWQDTTAGDFTVAASIGKSVMNGVALGTGLTVNAVTGLTAANLDTTVSSRMATYVQPSGFLAATFPGGTIANTTNITAAAGVAITSNIKQNQALANFEFMMTDSTNHAPSTGLAVTVTRSIDGGAFAAGALSAVTEVSNGIYRVDFAASDLNGKVITLRATAAASDDNFERIVTQV